MTLSVDLFYSYRSPYSYLALPRTMQLVADYDLTVNLRPVYPLAVRDPTFFKRTNPKFLRYVALDAPRVAERENIPYGFPRPDPIVQDLTTLEVAAHQPYIHRAPRHRSKASRCPLPTRSPGRSGTAASRAGIRAII
jgi:2-hydroxychromene-2-carboxylate isomerase